jgi:hypothetical protein
MVKGKLMCITIFMMNTKDGKGLDIITFFEGWLVG